MIRAILPLEGRGTWTRLALMLLAAVVMLSAVAAALAAKPAEATHYRSAQLSWEKGSSSNQANFKSTVGLRWSFYSKPAVGATVYEYVYFGDGSWANVAHKVISVDSTNDWMLVEGTTSHTYSTAGPYTAYVSNCCRLSGPSHINNPDGNFYLQTRVDFGATIASPVSSVSPIVDCQKNATCRFVVPATDPDGQGLSYRLATSSEAGGFTQPSGATIGSGDGVYSWNTTGAKLAPAGYDTYYSTQVIIENLDSSGKVISKTPVDFFIRLTDTASTNNPPKFDSPTPADGDVIDVEVGSEAAFDMAAHDDDSGDQVTLAVQNKPSDATFTTSAANPASGKFSWTPSSAGSTILTLTAKDQLGLGATQRSVTINAKVTNRPPTADAGGPYDVDEGGSVQLNGTGIDPENGALTYAWDLDNDGQYDDSADQNPTFSAANLDGPNSYKVGLEVTDDKGAKSITAATADVNVRNVAPTATSFDAPASVDEGSDINLSLTNASDAAGSADTLSYAFDCDGDGTYGAASVTSTDSCSTTDDGTRTVKAKVSDEDGGEAEYNANVTVKNVAPVLTNLSLTDNKDTACVSGANAVGLSFSFDDPAKANDTYTGVIDWGDGSPTTSFGGSFSVNESHDYNKPGTYKITVNVKDEDGGQATQKEGEVSRQYQMSKLLAPVNAVGSSVFKYGNTIPLKVKITDCNNTPVSGLTPSIKFTKTSAAVPEIGINEGTSTSSANSDFEMRWSSTDQLYIYNLGTKSLVDGNATYAAIIQDSTTTKAFGPTTSQKFGLRTK